MNKKLFFEKKNSTFLKSSVPAFLLKIVSTMYTFLKSSSFQLSNETNLVHKLPLQAKLLRKTFRKKAYFWLRNTIFLHGFFKSSACSGSFCTILSLNESLGKGLSIKRNFFDTFFMRSAYKIDLKKIENIFFQDKKFSIRKISFL